MNDAEGLGRELGCLGTAILETKQAKGWNLTTQASWLDPNQIPADLALIHSEVSEALEAFLRGDRAGFNEELADVVIRVVGLTAGMGINLGAAIWAKVEKNREREFRYGGKRL